MKNISLILLLSFIVFGCYKQKENIKDPIKKTNEVLTVINGREYDYIYEELEIEKTPQNVQAIEEISNDIHNGLKEFGYPKEEKIFVTSEQKLPHNDQSRLKIESDSVNLIWTKTQLGENDEYEIEMMFIDTKSGLQLINFNSHERKTTNFNK